MKRLEVKEQNSYNFNAVMKGDYVILVILSPIIKFSLTCLVCLAEYKSIHDSVKTADYFARNVCLRVLLAPC